MALKQAIEATMTRFWTEAAPAGEPCLVRIRCSVQISVEHHFIGGRVIITDNVVKEEDEEGFLFHADYPANDLRSEGACRSAVRQMLMELPLLSMHYSERTEEGQWDALVPPGLVESLVGAGAAHDRSYACDVSMHVRERSVISEAKALLLTCQRAVAPPEGAVANRRDLGGAAQCVICMEELAAAAAAANNVDVTELPGCRHAFHIACILRWFDRAPTCPSCRRDMMQYLSPKERWLSDELRSIVMRMRE